jgi:hypothetical protein
MAGPKTDATLHDGESLILSGEQHKIDVDRNHRMSYMLADMGR